DPEQRERAFHTHDDDREHGPERNQEHVEKPADARCRDADEVKMPMMPKMNAPSRMRMGHAMSGSSTCKECDEVLDAPPLPVLAAAWPSSCATIALTPSSMPRLKSLSLKRGVITSRM